MEEISKEVLSILSKALNNEPITAISDWAAVLSEMEAQTVACIPYMQIRDSDCLTASDKNAYSVFCMKSMAKNMRLMNAQSQLVSILQENGIPFVVLKGCAAAMYYPYPLCRTMGDIDLIVRPKDFDTAYALMKAHFSMKLSIEEYSTHAAFMTPEGVKMELHRYFSVANRNKALDDAIYRGIDACETHEILNHAFPTLPPLENGAVLLYHIWQHLSNGGIGYRQVVDFREFLNSNRERVPEFLTLCGTMDLRALAEAMICVCVDHFGLQPDGIAMPERDAEAEAFLIEQFSAGGNFGRKQAGEQERTAELFIHDLHGPFQALRAMQERGLQTWEAAKKHAWLRPFAWLYRLIHYIRLLPKYGGLKAAKAGFCRLNEKKRMRKRFKLQ